MFDERDYLTTNQLARCIGCNPDTVRSWISAGLLHAVDARTPNAARPKWRISKAAWEAFEIQRSNIAQAKAKRIARERNQPRPKRKHV